MRGGRSRLLPRSSTGTHLQAGRQAGRRWGGRQVRRDAGRHPCCVELFYRTQSVEQARPLPPSQHTDARCRRYEARARQANSGPARPSLPAGELGAVGRRLPVAAAVGRAPAGILTPRVRYLPVGVVKGAGEWLLGNWGAREAAAHQAAQAVAVG